VQIGEVSFGFLWFPLVSSGLGFGGFLVFLWFPLFSFGFVSFPRENQKKRKPKENTNQSRKI
jgi:hypothetical protein